MSNKKESFIAVQLYVFTELYQPEEKGIFSLVSLSNERFAVSQRASLAFALYV